MSRRLLCGMLPVLLLTACEAFDNDRFDEVAAVVLSSLDAGPKMDAGGMDSGPAPRDSGTDAGFDPATCDEGYCWWSTETPDGCASAGKPMLSHRPSGTSDKELNPIYLALSSIKLGQEVLPDGGIDQTVWAGFGFDLDGTCTNAESCTETVDKVSCHPAAAQLPFDGDMCRDNTFARLQPVVAAVPDLGTVFGLSEDVFDCALHNGDYSTLTKISGYNGEANDAEVRVDLYTSVGIEVNAPWECPQEDLSLFPLWRASDKWQVDEDAFTEPYETEGELPPSKLGTTDAYVRDGYLVALLPPDSVLRMAGDNALYPGFKVVLQEGIMTARLKRTPEGTWTARDGLIAGAFKNEDMLLAFREIGLCPGGEQDAYYQSVITYVTETADLRADGMVDPDMDCDAMSVAIGFEADPATPGKAVPVSVPQDCPDVTPPDTDGGT